jgi:amidase
VAAAVRRAADALADDGFTVTETVPPGYEQAIELWAAILAADLRVMKPLLDQFMGSGGRQFLGYALDHLPASDLDGWAMAHTARHGLAQVMGGRYTELRCLAVAEAIEQRLGPLTPIDPVTG